VKRLIYTSSPSVVFDGVHGIHNGDETMPYTPSVYTLATLLLLNSQISMRFFAWSLRKIDNVYCYKTSSGWS